MHIRRQPSALQPPLVGSDTTVTPFLSFCAHMSLDSSNEAYLRFWLATGGTPNTQPAKQTGGARDG